MPPSPHPSTNPEADLARAFVLQTDRHVYLTGRAGTGKTTFLRKLQTDPALRKRHVVVAPTGVAAINAGGATIHSTFGLPFGTLTGERMRAEWGGRKFSRRKERVLKAIDLLVIDEISMVRADVLDGIDFVLRRYRDGYRPFGGVQLLLIGDLHQLPPVVTQSEEYDMRLRYETPYFFSAKALKQASMVTVELQHVYRQSDSTFIDLLGEVRAGSMTPEVTAALNARYIDPGSTDFPAPGAGYITLSSHRRTSDAINVERLATQPGNVTKFVAKVQGDFPPKAYPTEENLELKVGAQVMFVKNDPDQFFYNGKIGTVVALTSTSVSVECPGDAAPIEVGQVVWENTKYSLDEKTKEVSNDVAGSFTQVPLRLAWAITIHKSQGLTFDRVIIDAADAFAHGQVYVALSRCRSLEGVVLRSSLDARCVRTDGDVKEYTEEARGKQPSEGDLAGARRDYHKDLLRRAFQLSTLERSLQSLLRYYIEHERSYVAANVPALETIVTTAEDKVLSVGKGFAPVLEDLLTDYTRTEDPVEVPERCRKGALYLVEQLREVITKPLSKVDFASDDKQVSARTTERVSDLIRECTAALAVLKLLEGETFTAAAYERARTDAGLAGSTAGSSYASTKTSIDHGADLPHVKLFRRLEKWRVNEAARQDVTYSRIISTRSLRAVAASLPASIKELRAIPGIGRVKADDYGAALVSLVEVYCREEKIDASTLGYADAAKAAIATRSSSKRVTSTAAMSLSMYKGGKTVAEVAKDRGLKENTILSHLTLAVGAGAVPVTDFIKPDVLTTLEAYFDEHGGEVSLETFEHFEGDIDYGILKMALGHWLLTQDGGEEDATTEADEAE